MCRCIILYAAHLFFRIFILLKKRDIINVKQTHNLQYSGLAYIFLYALRVHRYIE